MANLTDPAAYLAEHYIYEINMLRGLHQALPSAIINRNKGTLEACIANALIEAFCIHARSLLDFYQCISKQDDVVASDFTLAGSFAPNATVQLPPDIRTRMNKQIAHLTGAREYASKIDENDRQALLVAIEVDHTAFKNAIDPRYATCFANEVPATINLNVSGNPSATNAVQLVGTMGVVK